MYTTTVPVYAVGGLNKEPDRPFYTGMTIGGEAKGQRIGGRKSECVYFVMPLLGMIFISWA